MKCSLDPQIDTVKIRTCVAEISQKPLLVLCFIKSSAGSSWILCRLSFYLSFILSGLNLREPCYLQVIFAYKLEVYYSSYDTTASSALYTEGQKTDHAFMLQ
jgi:hypothetical protein